MVENIFKGGGASTSYDFFDIAAGTGIQSYYGGIHAYRDATGIISGAILADNTFYSNEIVRTHEKAVTPTAGLIQSLVLDLLFNTTRNVNGNILVQVPIGFIHPTGGANNFTFAALKIDKISSTGTTTFIQSGNTMLVGSAGTGAGTAYAQCMAMSFTVSGMIFNRSERLRLTVDQYVQGGGVGASTVYYGIGCDPMNRNDTATNKPIPDTMDTQLVVQVPFKLDVEI